MIGTSNPEVAFPHHVSSPIDYNYLLSMFIDRSQPVALPELTLFCWKDTAGIPSSFLGLQFRCPDSQGLVMVTSQLLSGGVQ